MRRAVRVLAFLVTTSARGLAHAEGASLPLDLSWNVPAGCPPASTVVHRVEQILQGPAPTSTPVRAQATIRRLPSGNRFELVLAIQTADVEDARTIDASSCSALAEASAVVIALAIDPSRSGPEPAAPTGGTATSSEVPSPSTNEAPPATMPPAATPGPSPNAATSSAPSNAPSPARGATADNAVEPRPPTRVTPRFAFGVSPAMDIGTLPRVSAGALVTASLQLGRARLGVLGSAWIPQDAEFDAATHAGASFDMFTFGAWGSFMIPMRAFAFGPTVGVEDTHVRVEGFGIRAPEASWARWSTVVLGARAEARLIRWLLLTLRADVTVPIDPPTFTLGRSSTAEQLHDPADFGVRLSLGPEIVLP